MLTDGLAGLRAFDHILDAVRTGQPAFGSASGMGVFEFIAGHPEAAPSLTPLSRSEPPHSRRASPSTTISRGCAWSPTSAGACDADNSHPVGTSRLARPRFGPALRRP